MKTSREKGPFEERVCSMQNAINDMEVATLELSN